MPYMTKKQFTDYEKYRRDKNNGRILSMDCLRFICEANDYDPEKIGEYFLELLPKMDKSC